MTPIIIFIYVIYEVDIDRGEYQGPNEHLLPFTMSELYLHTKTKVNRFYAAWWSYVVMGFYTGAVIFSVYWAGITEGGVLFANG